MTSQKIYRHFVMPAIVPLLAVGIAAVCIIGIGQLLLSLTKDGRSELTRPELWVATGLALVILAIAGFLVGRPAGALGPLDQELAIGHRAMLAPAPPPVDVTARRGVPGTIDDLAPGFVLYARNGAYAKVNDVLGNVQEAYGHVRRGLIYAEGLYGAEDELWIPIEAVSAVYPESKAAFLAIAGDEAAAFGWDRPPAAFSRKPAREEPKLY